MEKILSLPGGMRILSGQSPFSIGVLKPLEIKNIVARYGNNPRICLDRYTISYSPFLIHRTIRIKNGHFDLNLEMRLSYSLKEVRFTGTIGKKTYVDYLGVPLLKLSGMFELTCALDEFGPEINAEKLFKLLPEELFCRLGEISFEFRKFFSGFHLREKSEKN